MLNKVPINMKGMYLTPAFFSPLGKADHNVVICKPLPAYFATVQKATPVLVRTCKNQRALFADSLFKMDWRPLYAMATSEEHLFRTLSFLYLIATCCAIQAKRAPQVDPG